MRQHGHRPCRQRRQPHAIVLGKWFIHFDHVGDECRQVDAGEAVAADAGLDPADLQAGFEHREQRIGFVADQPNFGGRRSAGAHQPVDPRLHAGQWRAQVMGEAIGDRSQFIEQCLDARQHGVERQPQGIEGVA